MQLGLIRIEILSINIFVTIRRYLNETIDFRIGIILVFSFKSIAQETIQHNRSYGVLFMAGMRHDDVRMCVATDAGVKGGPMADVQLVIRWNLYLVKQKTRWKNF